MDTKELAAHLQSFDEEATRLGIDDADDEDDDAPELTARVAKLNEQLALDGLTVYRTHGGYVVTRKKLPKFRTGDN